jgi:hypothetical protein
MGWYSLWLGQYPINQNRSGSVWPGEIARNFKRQAALSELVETLEAIPCVQMLL